MNKIIRTLNYLLIVFFSLLNFNCDSNDDDIVTPVSQTLPAPDYRDPYIGSWNLEVHKFGWRVWDNDFSSGSETYDTTFVISAQLTKDDFFSTRMNISNYDAELNQFVLSEDFKIYTTPVISTGADGSILIGLFYSPSSFYYEFTYNSDNNWGEGGNEYSHTTIVTGSR
jgi:hypothetical protein